MTPLLETQRLSVQFPSRLGAVQAVDDVSFDVQPGRVFGLVGESGCGKTMTALSLLRLVPQPGRIVSGRIAFEQRDLLVLPEREVRKIRGARIAMIFQEPMTSLNPVFTIGYQIAEAMTAHLPIGRREAWSRAVELLAAVGISAPEARAKDYPHHLSGGMRQRAMIAMAISCRPALLIADEPTTALDVTIQAQILDLLSRIREETGSSLLLITHDLGIIAETADEVAIMYAGQIVERTAVSALFARPLHPYARGLLDSLPRHAEKGKTRRLKAIPGNVPTITGPVSACRFAPRCPIAIDRCRNEAPDLVSVSEAGAVRCFRPGEA
jgi:oligopeptide/dipeptide ABC transporter ATP-binding protein